jgi:hypothetical protein
MTLEFLSEEWFRRVGELADAAAPLEIPLVAGDWSAGMKGYVARKIRLSGNMRKLIQLQVYQPTPSQTRLRQEILRVTAPGTGLAASAGDREDA